MVEALIPCLVWLAKSTLILLLAWPLVLILRASGASAAARHRVWLAAFVMLSLLPLFDLLPSLLSIPVPFGQLGFATHDLSVAGVHLPDRATTRWIQGLYGVGAGLCLLHLLCTRAALESRWRSAVPWAEAAMADRYAAKAGVNVPVEVRISPTTDSRLSIAPLTLGRRVLLPQQALQWPESQTQHVLLHEFFHLRRRDSVTRVLATLVRAAWWFNPAVWLALRALRTEQEHACDELVVAQCANPVDYARTLVDMALLFGNQGQGGAAAVVGHSALACRVDAILHASTANHVGNRRWIVLSVFLATLALLVAMTRPLDPARRLGALSPLAPLAPLTSDSPLRALAPLSPLAVVLDVNHVGQPENRR